MMTEEKTPKTVAEMEEEKEDVDDGQIRSE